MKNTFSIFSRLTCFAAAFASAQLASAATIAYANNFDGTGSNVAFGTENTDAQWTVGSGVYTNSYSSTGTVTSSAVNQFSDMTNATFTVSTQFTISSKAAQNGASNVTVGFSIFGKEANPANYYLADLGIYGTGAGNVRLINVGAPGSALTQVTASTGLGELGLNTTYTLKLDVVNTAANAYSLTLGLYDATGSTLQGSAVTANISGVLAEPSGGYYSGFRNRSNNASGTNTVNFDNYSVIPEPSVAILSCLGVLAMMRRRR